MHSAVSPQRVWIHEWRSGHSTPPLQRSREDLLLRTIPGLPAGSRHHPGISRSNSRATSVFRESGHRLRPRQVRTGGWHLRHRYAIRPGQQSHQPDPRTLSATEFTHRGLWSKYLRNFLQGGYKRQSVFLPHRSRDHSQRPVLCAGQLRRPHRADNQPRSNGNRSNLWRYIYRSPAQCCRYLDPHDFSPAGF